MKLWISILILSLSIIGLCVWDSVYTQKIFNTMEEKSENIYSSLLVSDISNPDIQDSIIELNAYWTEKMDILCISISRKDMQIVSDYIQYLYASIFNQSQEDAITYSRLLNYNIKGLRELVGISLINLV